MGYTFHGPDSFAHAIDYLLIVAPLKADAGRSREEIARDCASAMNWEVPKPTSKFDKQTLRKKMAEKLDRLLGAIDAAVEDSILAAREGEYERAAELLEPYNDLWVGFYPLAEATRVLASLRAY